MCRADCSERSFRPHVVLIAITFAVLRAQPPAETSLRTFLQSYLRTNASDYDKTTRYVDASVDLNGDGVPEVIVYLNGTAWCGSGGCTMLILAPEKSTFRVITRTTITRPPIGVLKSKSQGWHDLSVWVRGGGILPGYQARLRFDGQKYPSNPAVPPAEHLPKGALGTVVISGTEEGTLLHP